MDDDAIALGRVGDRRDRTSDPVREIVEDPDVARGEDGRKVVGVEQRLLERPGRLGIVAAPQGNHDHLDIAVRVGLTRHLVLEPEIDDATDAVVERCLPAGRREAPNVVRPHHHATSCTASRGRFQASQVADVETPVPRQRAAQGVRVHVLAYGAHNDPR